MMFRRILHLPLAYLLALSLLTNPVGAFGYVWCIGADGHNHAKSTQVAADGCCAPHQAAQTQERDDSLCVESKDHGHCLHIAIAGQPVLCGSRDGQALDDAAPSAPALFSASFQYTTVKYLSSNLFLKPVPRIADPLLQHRTIVLLI